MSHQAIYDAVRSRITGCDVGSIVEQVVASAFASNGLDYYLSLLCSELRDASVASHILMRPKLFIDGDQWCCLYGDDIMEGVAGFGDTPAKACAAFDRAFDTSVAQEGVAMADPMTKVEALRRDLRVTIARAARLAAECKAWRHAFAIFDGQGDPQALHMWQHVLHARSAVDAAGDLKENT